MGKLEKNRNSLTNRVKCLGITFIGAVFIYIFQQKTELKTELNFDFRRESGVKHNSENLTEYFTKQNGEIFYVVYNRVPKCGSGGTSNLLEQLSKTNNFESVFHYDKTDKHQLTEDVTRALSSEFQKYESRKFGWKWGGYFLTGNFLSFY